MEPTYHLPPNFSTPPPPAGPFHFDRRERMRPLNQSAETRLPIPNDQIYHDHKGGFEAKRAKLLSGAVGIWAKFLGLDGLGAEATISIERSDNDFYKFDSVDTEYFYPSPKYIAQCMRIPDVEDFLKGYNYKKPVYLVTGIKVARGASVRLNEVRKTAIKVATGPNNLVGPGIAHVHENSLTTLLTESSDVVVGIQCLKLYYKSSWFGSEKKLMDKLHTAGATFVDGEEDAEQEQQIGDFTIADAEDSGPAGYVYQTDVSVGESVKEDWVFPINSR